MTDISSPAPTTPTTLDAMAVERIMYVLVRSPGIYLNGAETFALAQRVVAALSRSPAVAPGPAQALAGASGVEAGANHYLLSASIWKRSPYPGCDSGEWVLEIEGTINDTYLTSRHTEPLSTRPEDVPGLPTLYAQVPDGDALSDAQAGTVETAAPAGGLPGVEAIAEAMWHDNVPGRISWSQFIESPHAGDQRTANDYRARAGSLRARLTASRTGYPYGTDPSGWPARKPGCRTCGGTGSVDAAELPAGAISAHTCCPEFNGADHQADKRRHADRLSAASGTGDGGRAPTASEIVREQDAYHKGYDAAKALYGDAPPTPPAQAPGAGSALREAVNLVQRIVLAADADAQEHVGEEMRWGDASEIQIITPTGIWPVVATLGDFRTALATATDGGGATAAVRDVLAERLSYIIGHTPKNREYADYLLKGIPNAVSEKDDLAAAEAAERQIGELKAALLTTRSGALEEAASFLMPKGPRPCNCDHCTCGNPGDHAHVCAWDEAKASADAVRALAEPRS